MRRFIVDVGVVALENLILRNDANIEVYKINISIFFNSQVNRIEFI